MPIRKRTELTWRTSSYSNANNGNCVEVAWRKSSYSNGDDGDCVEVAAAPGTIAVRDSKAPESGHLDLRPSAWHAFLTILHMP